MGPGAAAGAANWNGEPAGGLADPPSTLSVGFDVGAGLGFELKLNEEEVPVLAGPDFVVVFGPKEKAPLFEGNSNAGFGFSCSGLPSFA